jgi:hypothetical protein
MTQFLATTMGLEATLVEGVEADLFQLPDGAHVAVASPGAMGDTARSIGFLVDDLDEAIGELVCSGVWTGPVSSNGAGRYAHFRAPDSQLYELVERRSEP